MKYKKYILLFGLIALFLIGKAVLFSANEKADSSQSHPNIVVTTPFPTGEVTDNAMDVEYEAHASKGAKITEVSYIINGKKEEYIYLAGGDGISPKGQLGKARVLLLPEKNQVVFKVLDSSGKSATFEVKEQPIFQWGGRPPKPEHDEVSQTPGGAYYINNRISLGARRNVSYDEIQKIVDEIGGEIISHSGLTDSYEVRLPKKYTLDDIDEYCYNLLGIYPKALETANPILLYPLGA